MKEVYYLKKDDKARIGTDISTKFSELFGMPIQTNVRTIRLSVLDDEVVNIRITAEENFSIEDFDKFMTMLPKTSEEG